MRKKIVYFSLSIGVKKNKKLSEFTAISDLKYLMALHNEFDLHIIHPEEYDFQRRTVRASYILKIDNDNISFPQKKGTHEPKGDSFLVYSDGSRRNPGLKYMLEQYDFLKKLEENKNFKYFLNSSEVEKKTLKNYLPHLSSNLNGIAKTYHFSLKNFQKMISKYSSTVIKPIAGCGMKCVMLLKSKKDLQFFKRTNHCSYQQLENGYMLQEPLVGDEKRIIILGNKFLGSRVHINRTNAWKIHKHQTTFIYSPTKEELDIAINVTKYIGAELLSVDFIGQKVNEINGSGSDVVFEDHKGKIILNKIDEVVKHLKGILNKSK